MAAIYEDGKLTLSGFVGDDLFDDGFTYAQVLTALAEADGEDLVVHINSGGGFASEGSAIHALLAARVGRTDVVVDGIAASAASLIAMAGETVTMSLGSIMMVHDPARITFGTSTDHQKSVEELEALATTYARVYAEKTGQSVEEARAVMQAETWLTPEQAVERGFADAVGQQQAEPVAAMDYRAYAHAPRELVTAAVANGWQVKRKTAAGSAVASTSRHKEIVMTDKTKADAAAAQHQAAPKTANTAPAPQQPTAEADIEAAKAEAVKADRERRAAIMALDEAKGREALAEHLYDTTEMSADAIKAVLAKAPKAEGAPQASSQPPAEYEQARAAGAGLGGQPSASTSDKSGNIAVMQDAVKRNNQRRARK